MKTLENEKGLTLKPCVNWLPPLIIGSAKAVDYYTKICPCSNHFGEILRQNNIITRFNCTNRKMRQAPKNKAKGSGGTPNERSKRKGVR